MLRFHRKDQYDILKQGVRKPLLVINWETPDRSARLFCLWHGGVWFRLWGRRRLCLRWPQMLLRIYGRDHFDNSDKKGDHLIFLWHWNMGRFQICLMLGRWDAHIDFFRLVG